MRFSLEFGNDTCFDNSTLCESTKEYPPSEYQVR